MVPVVEACKIKPHAVCIPSPFQSHINAMLQFAKLLHHRGFRITFVNTEFNHQRLLKSRSGLDSSSGNEFSNLQFETIPDGLPIDPEENTVLSLFQAIRNGTLLEPFRRLLAKLNETASVTCIISDGFLSFTIKAAEEIGVPIVMLFTISACSLMGFKQLRRLKEKGITPLKDKSHLTKEYLDTVVDWIPGITKNIRIRDLPSFVRTTNPDDIMFNLTMEATEQASKSSFIVIHTFQALEIQVLDALSSMFLGQHVLPIGPLQLLLKKTRQDPDISSLRCDLLKPETECIQWLNTQKPASVVYVNFGSLTILTKEQVIELGMGLVDSKHPFLWIMRPDLVTGNSNLPAEFMEKLKQEGFISSWCPQEEVLNHKAIGGFLSHCGWNSTMESLCAGVPMICWPFSGDQQMNCRYACTEWGFGVEVSGVDDDCYVKRHEINKVVRELMEGEKGHEMRIKALEWKEMADKDCRTDGPSSINLEKLVNQVLLLTRGDNLGYDTRCPHEMNTNITDYD